MSLTVMIITYNNPELLNRCLKTLTAYTSGYTQLLVVNNNPDRKEDVEANLQDIPHPVDLVHMNEHGRAAQAINAGLMLSSADCFCAVSDDVCFVPGNPFWPSLLELTLREDVGMVGPSVDRGSVGHSINAEGEMVLPAQLFSTITAPVLQATYLMGMLLFARTDTWSEIGGCDDNLTGNEEADLCLAIMAAGYKCVIDKRIYLYHDERSTTKKEAPEFYADRSKKAQEYIIEKWGAETYFNPTDLPGFPTLPDGSKYPIKFIGVSERIGRHIVCELSLIHI